MTKPYHNPAVERAVRNLSKELESAFRELDRYIRDQIAKLNRDGQLVTYDIKNTRMIRKLLGELKDQARRKGFGSVLDKQADELRALAKSVLTEAKEIGYPRKRFRLVTAENIEGLMDGAHKSILAYETQVARELEQVLWRSATGGMRWMDIVKDVQKVTGNNLRNAMTRTADTLAHFHTQSRREFFEDRDKKGNIRGVTWWLYDGPKDERNRPFCRGLVGTRVTVEILMDYSRKVERNHPAPPTVSLGGWGCRHELAPLWGEEMIQKYPIGPRGVKKAA